MKFVIFFLAFFGSFGVIAQPDRWQQKIEYVIQTDVNVETNRFTGKQQMTYWNNSPDTLHQLFFHLYLNAFQPNSSMDLRSRELGKVVINGRQDWDSRVKDRIQHLKPDEIGFQKITALKVDGNAATLTERGTVLQVKLSKPVLPKTKVNIDLAFEAQIPLQVRRTGRDNPRTRVRYSMAQWYPKMAEYDHEGWHTDPYIAREFYGVWGDYDVTINIDKNYKLGGTGVLQNAKEIGWGYDVPGTPLKNISSPMRKWRFVAENVHDFVWAADPDYEHIVRKVPGGPTIHVIYDKINEDTTWRNGWIKVADMAVKVMPFIENRFGKYPYPQYSFIQGGDGGMEYAMATLIQSSSIGTAIHELMHSWYQMVLDTNESLYAWMDEGFTSFADELVTAYYNGKIPLESEGLEVEVNAPASAAGTVNSNLPEHNGSSYRNYYSLAKSGLQEPLTTHADHFNTNTAYSIAAYSMGAVFLEQLGYIVGATVRDKILLRYYQDWKFKHPNVNDFMVVAQKVSGLQLQWYKKYWVESTKQIDYGIDSNWSATAHTTLRLKRVGTFPMPVDVYVTLKSGEVQVHHIPLNLMMGAKKLAMNNGKFFVYKEWDWVNPHYELQLPIPQSQIAAVEIDGSKRMADVDRSNNRLTF